MNSMSRKKIEAFYREFPWLENVVPCDAVQSITVQRFDLETYGRMKTFFVDNIDGYVSQKHVNLEDLFVLNAQGEIQGQVGVFNQKTMSNWWRFSAFTRPAINDNDEQSVEKLCRRLDLNVQEIGFVVSFQSWDGQLVIYKAPRVMSDPLVIQAEVKAATAHVQRELNLWGFDISVT